MIVFRDPAEVPEGFGPSVVAIGKFDGVHAGHRAVLERARVDAAAIGARLVAVTFDRNPLRTLRPDVCPEDVIGVTQKVQLLAETGIDATLVLTFDEALAAVPAEQFVQRILLEALDARTIFVGEDFRFGHRGAGTPELLQTMGAASGFRVEVVSDVTSIGAGRRVSSTWIRELLSAGDVSAAAGLLGRHPSVWGEVVHGHKRGRELGFPTANLSTALEGFIPADGVYAGWLVDEVSSDSLRPSIRYPAAISVGSNPTFDDVDARQVEAYVLDTTDLDLYGHDVEVQFVARVRGMVAFEGIDALIAQMGRDVDAVREILT